MPASVRRRLSPFASRGITPGAASHGRQFESFVWIRVNPWYPRHRPDGCSTAWQRPALKGTRVPVSIGVSRSAVPNHGFHGRARIARRCPVGGRLFIPTRPSLNGRPPGSHTCPKHGFHGRARMPRRGPVGWPAARPPGSTPGAASHGRRLESSVWIRVIRVIRGGNECRLDAWAGARRGGSLGPRVYLRARSNRLDQDGPHVEQFEAEALDVFLRL